MKKEHTPTPWKVYQYGGVQIGQEDTGEAVCSMWGDKKEGEANAAHIVKCVNMHDELVAVMSDIHDFLKRSGYDTTMVKATLKKAGEL